MSFSVDRWEELMNLKPEDFKLASMAIINMASENFRRQANLELTELKSDKLLLIGNFYQWYCNELLDIAREAAYLAHICRIRTNHPDDLHQIHPKV